MYLRFQRRRTDLDSEDYLMMTTSYFNIKITRSEQIARMFANDSVVDTGGQPIVEPVVMQWLLAHELVPLLPGLVRCFRGWCQLPFRY